MTEAKKSTKKKMSLTSVKHAFLTIMWPRRKILMLGLFLIFINRFAGLVLPGSAKFLIDDVLVRKDTGLLNLLLLAVGVAIFFQASTSFFLTRLLSVEAQHLISQLRVQAQKQIVRLPIKFFDNSKSGELVSRIMTDVEGVRNLVGTGLVQLLGGIITAIISLIILLNINAMMTVFVIAPLLIFGMISMKTFAYIRPIFRERRKINADVTGRLTESLGGIRVIKGFNAEVREQKVFEQGVDRIFQNVKKTLTTTSFVSSLAVLLMGMTGIIIMGFGGNMIINDEMTVGDFVAFTLYLGFLIAPIVQMGNIGTQITEAFAGLDRMEEILQLDKESDDPARNVLLDDIEGNIIFENVSFAYEENNMVLKNITFSALSGTVSALVGSSGSGKTTLAGLAASFLTPLEGAVKIDGHNLATINIDNYRSRLGVVLQDEFLFEGTIRENILFGRPDASEEKLLDAVKSAHVKEFTDRFDGDLDTLIGERGVKLSGGQRQRVAIARAILADPRVLILDEATSNLDTESELFIQESLAHLMKGRTTIVIAHRLSTIKQADQILVVEDGSIVECGNHDSLLKKEGRYHKLYNYQIKI